MNSFIHLFDVLLGMVRQTLKVAFSRARYAAIGAAIGGALGGLISRSAASSGAALGALVGAGLGETRVSAKQRIEEVREEGEGRVEKLLS